MPLGGAATELYVGQPLATVHTGAIGRLSLLLLRLSIATSAIILYECWTPKTLLSVWDALPCFLAVGSRTMRRLIYLMNVSLDGFVEGPDGKFGWTGPDEEVHRFHQKRAKEMDGFLYGKRLYETMAVWQTIDKSSAVPEYMLEFARIWKSKPKIVFSTTLASVGENCRLVREDLASEVSNLRKQPGGDLGVGGPGLADSLAKLDLIDEYQMVVFPTIVGAGKSYFPSVGGEIQLRLVETAKFACGATYLRYERI